MELRRFEITEITAFPDEGFTRARTEITFANSEFGDEVFHSVRVGCFVKHSSSATLETIERECLQQAHRLLSVALKIAEAGDPAAIRSEARASCDRRDARMKAESDAALEEALKGIGSPQ